MNREVEERIVAMYFDNKDFEKNAKQTIDTLGQLKEGLDLEESVKGFETLDKAGKQLNLSRANQTVKTFKESVGGLRNVLKKAFDIGTSPLKPLVNLFNTFEDYTKKFLGFDLAGKFVNKMESMVSALTTAPISAGWSMYQQNVDTMQTILSGTKLSYTRQMQEADANWSYDEAEHLQYVKDNLAELTEYANQTVYSLQDMTSNVGKFTNQGVDLKTSVRSMEGIANATAKAGQGAQQASMAMYNISQAIGVGKMTTIDWKSIENANIATEELKNTFIETAAAAGQLVKEVDKDGKAHYWTVDENTGKKTKKSMEVTVENFRETLSKDWLDKETMLRTFALYSGENLDIDTLKSWGLDDEQIDKFLKMGQEAKKAATEVRTFSKMMDALSESVQSGWAKSFEYIIGDVKEATAFWTRLSGILEDVLGGMTERRNSLLLEWRGMEMDEEGHLQKIKGVKDGREDLVMGFFQIVYALKDLGSTISEAWTEVFGGLTGSRLREITEGFRKFAFNLRNWLGVAGKSGTRLEKLKTGLKGVFSILKLVINRVKNTITFAMKFIAPLSDVLLDLFAGIFGFFDGIQNLDAMEIFEKIGDGLSELWSKIVNFFRPGAIGGISEMPFVKVLKNAWNTIKSAVKDWASGNGLDGIVVFFRGIKEGAEEAWEAMVSWFKEIGLDEFFNNFGQWCQTVGIGAVDFAKEAWDAGSTGIVNFFNKIVPEVQKAWGTVTAWFKGDEFKSVIEFGKNAFDWVTKHVDESFDFFADIPQKVEDLGIIRFFNGIGEAITGAWESVKTFFTSEETKSVFTDITAFASNSFGWLSDNFGIPEINFAGITDISVPDVSEIGFVKFLNDVKDAFDTAWTLVRDWFTNEDNPIGFFTDTWGWITGQFSDGVNLFFTVLSQAQEGVGFAKFLDTIRGTMDESWSGIIDWFGDTSSGIGLFLSNTWDWLVQLFDGAENFFTDIFSGNGDIGIVTFLNGITEKISEAWGSVYNWFDTGYGSNIIGFFSDAWNWLSKTFNNGVSFFTEEDPDVGETGFEKVIHTVGDSIKGAWDGLVQIIKDLGISDFFSDAWKWLSDLVNGVYDSLTNGGVEDTASDVSESVSGAFEDISSGNYIHPLVEFLQNSIDSIKDVWEDATTGIYNWDGWEAIGNFLGDIWQFIADKVNKAKDWFFEQDDEDGSTGFSRFLTNTWEAIKDAWNAIISWPGWASIGEFFTDIWAWLVDLFNGIFNNDESQAAEEVTAATGTAEKLKESTEGFKETVASLSDDDGKSVEQGTNTLTRILGSLGEFFDKVTNAIGISGNSEKITRLFDDLKKLLDVLLQIIHELVTVAHDLIVSGNWGSFGELLLNLTGLVGSITLVTSGVPALLQKVTGYTIGSMGSELLKISIGIVAMAYAMSLIADIPSDKLGVAATIVMLLMGVVASVLLTIDNMQARASVENPQMKGERLLNKLITWVGIIGSISVVMALLPNIISAFKDSDASGEDVLKTLEGVTIMVSVLTILSVIVAVITQKLGASIDSSAIAKVMGVAMLVIVAVTAFLYGLGEAIKGIGVGKVVSSIEAFKSVISTVAGALGSLFGSIIGEFLSPITRAFGVRTAQEDIDINNAKIDTFMENMQTMVDKFGGDFLYDLALFMNTMQHFSEEMDEDKINTLGTFGKVLVSLGDGINSFYTGSKGLVQGSMILYEGHDAGEVIKNWKTPLEVARETAEAIGPLISAFADVAKNMPTVDYKAQYESWRENIFSYITEMLKFLYGGMGIDWADVGIDPRDPNNWEIMQGGTTPLQILLTQIGDNLGEIEPLVTRLRGIMELVSTDIADTIKEDFGGEELTSSFFNTMTAALASNKLQFDATPVVDAIIYALGLGENAIALAIHDIVQNGINLLGYINGSGLELDMSSLLEGTEYAGKQLTDLINDPNGMTAVMQILNEKGLGNLGSVGGLSSGFNMQGFANNWFLEQVAGGFANIDENGMIEGMPDLMGSMYSMFGATDQAGMDANVNAFMDRYNTINLDPSKLSFGNLSIFDDEGNLTLEGDNMIKSLEAYEGEIETYLNEHSDGFDLTVKVTPVINMDNWPSELEKLNDLEATLPYRLERGLINLPNVQFDLQDLQQITELRSLNDRVERAIGAIVNENAKSIVAINNLGARVDRVSSTIASMKLVLDTGLLVGGITPLIDKRLAQKSWLYDRTGVVAMEQ